MKMLMTGFVAVMLVSLSACGFEVESVKESSSFVTVRDAARTDSELTQQKAKDIPLLKQGQSVCLTQADCTSGFYCKKSSCGSRVSGFCELRPARCPAVSGSGDDVCGCNGTWYSNACVAAQNGMNTQATSACGVPPGF